MKANKTVLGTLDKCYALGTFHYDDMDHIAFAAETPHPCYTFSLNGQRMDTLWQGPGGVMSLAQVPGRPILLATRRFYSPNDSAVAEIVSCRRINGAWTVETLCHLPFVHRFGILSSGGRHYLIACTIKSGHKHPDDWSSPGRVYGALLPDDITQFNADHPLELTPIADGLLKNHGFSICQEATGTFAVIGSESGILKICPPSGAIIGWQVETLLNVPASDILYLDFDGDGERELLVFSPFHGDTLTIWKNVGGAMQKVYQHEKPMPMLHAIWGAEIDGLVYAFVGCRQGDRELLALHYDKDHGYICDLLDRGAGPANVLYCRSEGRSLLFAANRETDEMAMYTLHTGI